MQYSGLPEQFFATPAQKTKKLTPPSGGYFDLPSPILREVEPEQYFAPGRGFCSGRKPLRFIKPAQKYPWVPKNVWSGILGTENPNMKLVLV